MKAQIITQFGKPSVFQYSDIALPLIKPGHVLVKIGASSVNQIDCKIRSGLVPELAPKFPAVLGCDIAGTIEAVAEDVENFKIGDEVYGCAGGLKGTAGGALAEYILADVCTLAIKPQRLSFLESAALPLVSITAWEALFQKAQIKPGQHILIHGGTGGVGHIAVQLAKWKGATVSTTVINDEDIALAKSLGADEVINAKVESVSSYLSRLTDGNGFDVVFDTIGGPNLDNSFAAVGINGAVVTTAARSSHDLSPLHNKALSLHAVFMLLPLLTGKGRASHGHILKQLSEVVAEGKLSPLIDPHVFTLESANEAHTWLESGRARGKVVIK